MDTIRNQLQEIVNTTSKKHISLKVRKNEEIMKELNDYNRWDITNLSELVWLFLNNETPICKNGKKRRFISITEGLATGCGSARNCECVRESVSLKVKETYAGMSDEKRLQISEKRKTTNLEKYGHENSGQSEYAKNKHREFYSNKENITRQLNNQKSTLLERYGVDNWAKTEENKKRMKENSPMKNPEIAKKSVETRQKLYEKNPKFLLEHSYKKLKEKLLEHSVLLLTDLENYTGVSNQKYYDFQCTICNHQYSSYVDNGHIPVCKLCNPTIYNYQSKEETELFEFVKSLVDDAHQGNRSLINPYELDIVIPSKRLAIEYCGLYWHSDFFKNRNYHKEKMLRVNEKGYQLITIFSDEWVNNRDVVKNVLRHKLGHSKSIHARKCEIRELSTVEEREFLNSYHIQGYHQSRVCYGLIYQDRVVGCMSFSPVRKYLNRHSDNWEIIRMCFSDHTQGGASKLLNRFKKEFDYNIETDCDLRWGNGNGYLKLGFEEMKESAPNYWWIEKFTKRHHRLKFMKRKLVESGCDPSKTEAEIMYDMGYSRIWDCGVRRFIFKS